ncbi:uncharacterized protein M437DRAFT_12667, partial [Aureobasidium melanogenum CBS 110374]
RVTEEIRLELAANLDEFSDVLGKWSLPSRYTLARYVEAFVSGFHPSFPVLHLPTFRLDLMAPELSLAICAVGAQYCFESKAGAKLFYVSRSLVFEQMRRREETLMTAGRDVADARLAVPPVLMQGRSMQVANPVWPEDPLARRSRMHTACATMFLLCFASWQKDAALLRESFALQGLLARCCRENGLVEDVSESPPLNWPEWIEGEFQRRIKMTAFCVLNLQSIAYNLPPTITASEVHLNMPCPSAEWSADSELDWHRQRASRRHHPPTFQQALSSLLVFDDPEGSRIAANQATPTPFANYVLMHALIQRLQMLWLLVPTTGKSAKLRAEDVSIMQEAFKRWKAAWQTSPEASLDPTNPEGPMSFVSATFLALAYVRLQVDLGPFRLLQTRDPVAIGLALYNSPLPCRGQDLISPLLHSAHSLDVVVRLGIHYVSHHQTFFWSVQHCIAVLECAVLLVQWLRVLESPGENRGLSHLEEQIFKWTEFLIGEARESLASDGSGADRTVAESQGMASTILRIWAGIFRSNKMWPIVQCIGDGLHHFANMIEK